MNHLEIETGRVVSISQCGKERRWKRHCMRRSVKGQIVGGSSGAVIIEVEGWLIMTRSRRGVT